MAIRNEILAAESRLKLSKRPVVMVMPERDVPGLSASAWPAPTMRASFTVYCSMSRRAGMRSAIQSTMPNTISETAMIGMVPSLVSMLSANSAPTAAAGSADRSSSHARRPSRVARWRGWRALRMPSRA